MRIAAGLAVVLAVGALAIAYAATRGGARPELTGVELFDRCVAAQQRRIQRSLPRERRRLLAAVRKAEGRETPRLARLMRRSVEDALHQMRQPGYAFRAASYGCSGPTVIGPGPR